MAVLAYKKENAYVFKVKAGESCMPARTTRSMKKRVEENAARFAKLIIHDDNIIQMEVIEEK